MIVCPEERPRPPTPAGPGPWVREEEVEFSAIRAQGAGGQNVNKASSAVHLRYRIADASLPDDLKERLLGLRDHRITADGVVVIKAQTQRSQEQNRQEALQRLQALIDSVAVAPKARRPTRPTRGSRLRRLQDKTQRGQIKQQRSRPRDEGGH